MELILISEEVSNRHRMGLPLNPAIEEWHRFSGQFFFAGAKQVALLAVIQGDKLESV